MQVFRLRFWFCNAAVLFLIPAMYFSQGRNKLDSLLFLSNKNSGDSNAVKQFNDISWQYFVMGMKDSAIYFAESGVGLGKKNGFDKGVGKAYHLLGYIYGADNETDKAIKSYLNGLKYKVKLRDAKGTIALANNIAENYRARSEYSVSLEWYFRTLKLCEDVKDTIQLCNLYGNIGTAFWQNKEYHKAIEFYSKQLNWSEKTNLKPGSASALSGLANSYKALGDSIVLGSGKKETNNFYKASLPFYSQAADLYTQLGNTGEVAHLENNLGNIHLLLGENETALEYFLTARKKLDSLHLEKEIAMLDANIGGVYLSQKKFKEAALLCEKSLLLAKKIRFREAIKESEEKLAQAYFSLSDYRKSFEHYTSFIAIRDSLFNELNTKKAVESEMNYEFEKKQAFIRAGQDKKDAIAASELKQQKLQRNYFIGGFILLLVTAVIILRGFIQKKRANMLLAEKNTIITKQKHLVEEKQKEILDSIYYARRIQRALITNEKYIDKNLRKLNCKQG